MNTHTFISHGYCREMLPLYSDVYMMFYLKKTLFEWKGTFFNRKIFDKCNPDGNRHMIQISQKEIQPLPHCEVNCSQNFGQIRHFLKCHPSVTGAQIGWGTGGHVPPTFESGGDTISNVPPTFWVTSMLFCRMVREHTIITRGVLL